MKLKVCVEFCDRVTDAVYHVGDVIEVTDKRGAEILANPLKLAEAVEAPQPQKSASKPKAATRKKRGDEA